MLKEPYNKGRLEKRLFAKRAISGDHWLWIGCKAPSGHGRIGIRHEVHYVSRVAAYIWLGLDIFDNKLQALHKEDICRLKNCFIPDHLYIGTQSDNVADTVREGNNENGNSIKIKCKNGHALSDYNLMIIRSKDGIHRRCRICHNNNGRIAAVRWRFRHCCV